MELTMADAETAIPFVDGTGNLRQQLSTANASGYVVPQTALRANGGAVEAGNPLPMRSAPVPLLASTAIEASHVFRTAPASLFGMTATGLSAFAWLLVFDATSVPADGPVAPLAAIQATSLASVAISFGGVPAAFATGVVGVLSTTGPFIKTTGPTGFFSAMVT
jgi:hypothetical protein